MAQWSIYNDAWTLKKKYILSLDGGGVRTIATITFLQKLENQLGVPLADKFDFFIGTSAGAISSLGLAVNKMSAVDLMEIWSEENLNRTMTNSSWETHLGIMQINPKYGDVIDEIKLFLEKSNNELIDLGVSPELIINDPGIGFGKLLGHNIELLKSGRDILCDQKLSLMWGVSRKRMFADLLGRDETIDRLAGTLGVAAMALEKEVDIIRVHDVPEHRDLFETMKVIGG